MTKKICSCSFIQTLFYSPEGISSSFSLLPLSGWTVGPFVTCTIWGIAATAYNVAAQAEIIRHTSEEASPVGISVFSGLFNVGIGLGSVVGGAVCDGPGLALVGVVGGAIAGTSALYCVARLGRLLERTDNA